MTDFLIKKLPCNLTSNAALARVGQFIKRMDIEKRADPAFPVGLGRITSNDIMKSYLGLLVQGKSDFEAIEALRFARCLELDKVPSSPSLHQGLDTHAHAEDWFDLVDQFNMALLSGHDMGQSVDFGALACG